MDLLCTENIPNDYENDETQQQQHQHHQHQQQQQKQQHQTASSKPVLIPSAPSPCSNSLSNSSASSGYGSLQSNSSCASCTGCSCGNHSHSKTKAANAASQSNNVYINNCLSRKWEFVNTATEDPTFLQDRCLENALKAEEKRPQPICTYFKSVQKDITPPMRKIVAEWMMEVCAEEKCQEEVVLLALNYMDRFLSTKSVRKTHLQILAAACLLLASKLREPSCRALSAELLVFYTDNSIHKNDLIKWELYVLSRLGWDLASVTPLDFLELLLIRLPIRNAKCPDLNLDKVRQHAQAFISLAAKEHYFSVYSASTIAASSIAAALIGLNWHLRTGHNLRHLLDLLTDLTSIEQDFIHDCMLKMESVFAEHSRNLQPYLTQQMPPQPAVHQSTMQHQQQRQRQQQQQHHHHHHNHNQNSHNYQHPHNQQQHHQHQQQQQAQRQQQSQQQQHQQYQQQQQQQLLHTQHPHQQQHQHHQQHQHQHPMHNSASVVLPDLTQTCKMQAHAQKDVQDIKF